MFNDGVKGIFLFVVFVNVLGIIYGKVEEKMGWNVQLICMIMFDNVEVSYESLLGEYGQGFIFVMKGFDGGCINIVICLIGIV